MSLTRNTIANYLGRGWEALMGLAFIPIYIQQLGIEAWGLVGFMTMLQAWLLVLDMGLSPALSREMARFKAGVHSDISIRNLLRTLEVIYLGIAIITLTGLVLSSTWLANHWIKAEHLSNDTIRQAIVLMSIVIVSRIIGDVYRGSIQGLQQMVWLNAALAMSATVRWAGVALWLIWVNNSIHSFFLWHAIVSVATVLILLVRTYSYIPGNFSDGQFNLADLISIRQFAGGMFAISLLAVILTQMSTLMLSKLLPLKTFGFYTLATTIAGGLLFLVVPVTSAVYPKLTELFTQKRHKEFITTYHRASQWIAVVLVPSALMMAIFSRQILWVWTGNEEVSSRAGELLSLLALGTMFNGLMYMPYMAQLAHGWTKLAAWINAVAVAIIVPALLLVVPSYGALGAAWIWVALNFNYLLFGIPLMHKKIMPLEKYNWYTRSFFVPLFVAAAVIILSKRLLPVQDQRTTTGLLLLLTWCLALTMVAFTTPVSIEYARVLWRKHTKNRNDQKG